MPREYKKASLTCQSRRAFIVIRKNKEIPLSKISSYCDSEFEKYAFIEHKGHIQPDSGEVEGVHYHIVGDFLGTKVAYSTRLNSLCKYFGFDNAIGIEIDTYKSFASAIQYLTHKNQPEKTQCNKKDIITNIDSDEFDIYYNAETDDVITFDLLFSVLADSHNIIELIKSIGLGNYRAYRNVIWDMWQTMKDNKDFYK